MGNRRYTPRHRGTGESANAGAHREELLPYVLPLQAGERQTVVPLGAQVKLVAGSQHRCQTDLVLLARPPRQYNAFFIGGGVPTGYMSNWCEVRESREQGR